MAELGKRLEEARKQKNLTLDELQAITKIQKRYLIAIEEGNYEVMPGKFYARAFIKQYAEAVDLDSEQLFDQYASEIPTSESEVTSGLSRTQKKQNTVSDTSSLFFSILPKLLVAILVVSVAVFFWMFLQGKDEANTTEGDSNDSSVVSQEDENVTIVNPDEDKDSKQETQEKQDKDKPDEMTGEPDPQQDSALEPAAQQLVQIDQKNGVTPYTTYELKDADKFSVELLSTGTSYIGIENGKGNSFYAGELQKDQTISYDFTSEEEIEFNIGRTLDVAIKINGQAFEFPFPPNEKVHQKIKIIFNKAIQ